MNERKENQSDAHPTQINRVATRSNSKMSFMFQSLSVLADYCSFGGLSYRSFGEIVISERRLSFKISQSYDVGLRTFRRFIENCDIGTLFCRTKSIGAC